MLLPPPHPANLDDDTLLAQCEITFGRQGGPGGQHRNKVDTAVRLRHEPTGIDAGAAERRRQQENRRTAIRRLRLKLAIKTRTKVDPVRHRPSPVWESRRQGRQLSINPKHRDYPAVLAEALDVVYARGFDVAGAAGVLGVSMSQLAKLIRHEKHAMALVNAGRAERGLPPLK
ncbi:MAG: peptide chain release factor-like protein [Phycisphaerales bacterium]|nr:peptide chain release factor-like protein [Phycisphaerales bacterium]NNM26914.1 peptide chain release factor-like protein [Phycisphaerales bacterium]